MEKWKPIEGRPSYFVSDLGRVKSTIRGYEKILRQNINGSGYLRVNLNGGGQSGSYLVHRLVAAAFIPNPRNVETVNHIDGDKTNNSVNNLEWQTRAENLSIGHTTGLFWKAYPAMKSSRKTVKGRVKRQGLSQRQKELFSVPVVCNETGDRFMGMTSAIEWLVSIGYTKARNSAICMCCKGLRSKAYGYTWSYAPPSE